MTQPNRVFTRSKLEIAVWGEEQETSDTLRGHMHILRRALANAGGYDPIQTVHGMGYRVVTAKTN
jgi:DNA-binding response OmpR family regulator